MREYGIAPDEYLDYIHNVTHSELKYDEQLKLNLKNLTGRKFIYTNASKNHSKNILSLMGIEAEFEKILDIKATQYLPKPDPKSYNIMLKAFGISGDQIGNSIFIEDTAKNLRPAKVLGIKTVWIENEFNLKDYRENSEFIDYKYSDLKSFLNDIDYRNWLFLKGMDFHSFSDGCRDMMDKKVLDLKERRFYIRMIVTILIIYMVGTLFYKAISPFHNCIRDEKANVIQCTSNSSW